MAGVFKFTVALLGTTLAIFPAAGAESDRGMAACAAVESSVERLACYDGLAKKRDVAEPRKETATKGEWLVNTETSKIDDSKNVSLTLLSEESFKVPMKGTQKAAIQITCREKSTHFFVYMGGMFLADSGGFDEVTYRIDKKKAQSMSLSASTNNEALGLWQGTGISFLKQLMQGQRLLLQVTPFNESPITVEFKIAGLAEAIKPLRQACGW